MKLFAKHTWTKYRSGRPQLCERCGSRRRHVGCRREYREGGASTWSTTNPPCAEREDATC